MRRNLTALKGLCIDSPVDTHSGLWWWISGWGSTRDIQGGTDLHCAGARTAGTVAIALLSAPLPCSSQTGTSSLCPPCHMVNSESVLAGEIFPLHPVFPWDPAPPSQQITHLGPEPGSQPHPLASLCHILIGRSSSRGPHMHHTFLRRLLMASQGCWLKLQCLLGLPWGSEGLRRAVAGFAMIRDFKGSLRFSTGVKSDFALAR